MLGKQNNWNRVNISQIWVRKELPDYLHKVQRIGRVVRREWIEGWLLISKWQRCYRDLKDNILIYVDILNYLQMVFVKHDFD